MRTIFDSHPGGGVAAVAISRDARYLVTISAGRAQVRETLPPLGLCVMGVWEALLVGGGQRVGLCGFCWISLN